MKKPDVAKIAKGVRSSVVKHAPELLLSMGIAGTVSTTIMAVRATPKALRLLEEKARMEKCSVEDLTFKEKTMTCWKCYAPAVATGVTSIACLVGGNSVHVRRNAALAAAYTFSDTAFREYREKVIETIGEKKEKDVKDKIAQDRVKNDPASKSDIIITGRGNTLCYDAHSGRYFRSDIDKIRKAENNLNKRLLSEMYISLNELYDELGLSHTELGESLGWNVHADGLIELYFTSFISDEGEPCLVVNYETLPRYDYSSLA